ncbi:DinB family protein [Deinococcus yavapaiensis]|uniref:DinB family protein n=1 Tax=Deinococcus yavapaiensis KR-236 TaxID=694435 RepID=A0A318SCW3_9DEIO|nr:DinB family protein [Deinococcus yavapaiensis]PYE56493.1 DinB family protein [Deinococcus yavapaiensis KR-236]
MTSTPDFLASYGATPSDVARQLRLALTEFEDVIRRVPSDRFFTPVRDFAPSDDYSLAWSPAQQLEHVLKANTTFSKLIYLLNSDRALPDMPKQPGETVNGRFVAPEGLRPAEGVTWDAVEATWRDLHARLDRELEKANPASTRAFWHPFFGDLNALDWGRVAVLHTRRHTKQLGVA